MEKTEQAEMTKSTKWMVRILYVLFGLALMLGGLSYFLDDVTDSTGNPPVSVEQNPFG